MIVQAPKQSEYATLSFATGSYSWDRLRTSDPTKIPQLSFVSPGGIAVAPTGALSVVPAGQPRIIPSFGLLVEPSARNVLDGMDNVAPTSTSGWTLLNSRPSGATITLVDDTTALRASGLFDDLLTKGIMSGKVIRLDNPSTTTEFAIPMFDASSARFGFSAYVRCIAGAGYLAVTGGGGVGDTFTNSQWQRVGRVHTGGTQGRIIVKPSSTVLVILAQAEPDRITSPIILKGSPVTRVADKPVITSPNILGKPHTLIIEGEIALQNNIERTLCELSNDSGQAFVVSRTTDGALTANLTGGYKKPCVPRLLGPGKFRVAHRVGTLGHSIAGAGISGHAPYVPVPSSLNKLTIGSRRDGSLPLTGWIREIKLVAEVANDKLEAITAGPADAFLPETRRYVSPNGDDTNDGRTVQTPWKTMANVRDPLQFWPGTHFYFERGGTWAETLLPTNKCTYRPYGSGAAPRIGVGQQYGLDENAANDFRVTGLHFYAARSRGVNCYGASGVILDNNEVSNCGSLKDDNAIAIAIRGNTRKAEAELIAAPADVTVNAYATTEAGLTGEYVITCTVGGSGADARWQAKRPDGSIIDTAIGGTEFSGGGIKFTLSGTATVGDVVKIRNKAFADIALPTNALAEDVWIENNHVHDNVGRAAGDAIYVEGVGGICGIIGNLVPPPLGVAADCIQIGRSSRLYVARPAHAIIRDNRVAAYKGGGKGAIVCLTESCLIEGNVVEGNNFCIGFNSMTYAVVRWNVCYNSTLYDYSWAIGIGTDFDCANVEIYSNVMRNCARGINLSGIGGSTLTLSGRIARLQNRSNIKVINNLIENCGTALFVDRPTSGMFERNTIKVANKNYDVRVTSGPPGEPLIALVNNTLQ
ncbi:right-handed parallel beta-helix repeat-containing protein [Sphingomonas sp. Leaf257]|jgi:hypothetical protein|uniref:right-handed parallel beta-helix repeat-containing protein n=1 Tax=Sphingomonas sp. Leaf257 TaxID=1736309 RepID=UPI0006FA8477|nr:right-handed parallel beta-helix repeat-containing protein [Sphingomonas sp. Leaf257]KQO58399.1 hypothetical protein ASF14_00055 [Sphingomonas sp. Leaf257]